MKSASPLSYSETFSDQVHGWMTSRYVELSSSYSYVDFVAVKVKLTKIK